MTTRSAAYNRLVKGLFRFSYPESDDPEAFRETLRRTAELFTMPTGVRYREATIGGVRAEWVEPANAREGALMLYLHGGAYCMGGIETYRHYVARFAEIARLRTVHIDYRLAPEHPCPAAVDDATAVFCELAAREATANRMVIAGDSAGGGLTLATLISLRDRNLPLPCAAAVISPWTDLTLSGEHFWSNQPKDPIIHTKGARRNARWYAGANPLDHSLVSPLFADLAGLPPLLIHVGTEEALLDDSLRLAERARAQGVPVDIDVWEGMVHVWRYYAEWVPEARDALAKISVFFEDRLDATALKVR